jgi:S-adenosylmethionine hydrolase
VRDIVSNRRERAEALVTVNSVEVGPIRSTYADVPAGNPVALIDSADMLEIAVNTGNASESLNAGPGADVQIRWSPTLLS